MNNGQTDFYKDGYTDISGRFDYASLSVDKLKGVEKFAILVKHDKYGSKVFDCNPPLNVWVSIYNLWLVCLIFQTLLKLCNFINHKK